MSNTVVAGVGMAKFEKPGNNRSFRVMAGDAITMALDDAGLEPGDINQAFASHVYEVTGSGQHAIYDIFQTGIPIINLNNACASGSSGIYLARQLVESDAAECVLVVGFDEMPPGAISLDFPQEFVGDRIDRVLDAQGYPKSEQGGILRWFGAAGMQYMDKYDAKADIFAKVAVKSRNHAMANPFALFTTPIEEEEVLNSRSIYGGYMTKLMACPPTCGAAAAIIVSEKFARQRGLRADVEIAAQSLMSDTEASWVDAINASGADNTARAASDVYEQAGIGPDEIDVVELHDCFTINEVVTYESLQLCPEGGATKFIADGDNTYGGAVVVNPSGGLMSKGHPIGATGLAQCCELAWQLRGEAGARQVPDARFALQHNIGLVAASIVTLYRHATA